MQTDVVMVLEHDRLYNQVSMELKVGLGVCVGCLGIQTQFYT